MTAKRPLRVLVVDDEDGARRVAERAFQNAGYAVTSASNGHQALARMEQSAAPFDLFLLDVGMPAMGGIELAARIRERQPDAKVLYLTGYSDRLFTPGKSVLPGNEAFLEKPASLRGMVEAASLLLFGHTRGPQQNAEPDPS